MRPIQAVAPVLGAVIVLASAAPARATPAPSSYAFGVAGVILSQNTGTSLPPVGRAAGATPQAYNHRALVPLLDEQLGLVSGGTLVGVVEVNATGIATQATSGGSPKPTVTTAANAAIATLSVMITLLPPSAHSQPAAAPLLLLTSGKIAATLTDTRTLPNVGVFVAHAAFTHLALSGPLAGPTPLSFDGAAPANTVIYEDAHTTITLNKQQVTGSIACSPFCQFVPAAMKADAVQLFFNKTPVPGTTVNGEIDIAETQVQIP